MSESRGQLPKMALAAGAAALTPRTPSAAASKPPRKAIDEFDPANIKISHRAGLRVSDDDLLFLKQIGLRFVRAGIPLDAFPEGSGADSPASASRCIAARTTSRRSSRCLFRRAAASRRLAVFVTVLDWLPGQHLHARHRGEARLADAGIQSRRPPRQG